MTPQTLYPVAWSELPDFESLAPIDAGDLACMAELRDVLARHGRLGRFALHLAHRHFALRDDEVMVETTDAARREQSLRPEPRRLHADAVPTTWLLGAGGPLVVCVCATRPDRGHLGRHETR